MTTVRTAVHKRATTNRPGGGQRVRLIRAVEWIRSVLRTTTTSLVPGNVALMELAHGNWVTATLYVAAKLNIADELRAVRWVPRRSPAASAPILMQSVASCARWPARPCSSRRTTAGSP